MTQLPVVIGLWEAGAQLLDALEDPSLLYMLMMRGQGVPAVTGQQFLFPTQVIDEQQALRGQGLSVYGGHRSDRGGLCLFSMTKSAHRSLGDR